MSNWRSGSSSSGSGLSLTADELQSLLTQAITDGVTAALTAWDSTGNGSSSDDSGDSGDTGDTGSTVPDNAVVDSSGNYVVDSSGSYVVGE